MEADANTTMVLCNSMERKGWAKRNRDPADKRVNRISITPEGKTVFQQAYPLILEDYTLFTKSITMDEIGQVLPILSRLYARIDERYREVKQ